MPIYFKIWTVILRQLDGTIWKNFGNGVRSSPAGFKLTRKYLQSRVKKKDSVTNVENAVLDFGVMDLLCFLFVD